MIALLLCILNHMIYAQYTVPDTLIRYLQKTTNTTEIPQNQWETIRIQYVFIQDTSKEHVYISAVMNVATQFLQQHLLVKRQTSPIKFEKSYLTTWNGIPIPESLRNRTYSADLVLFVNIENNNQSYLAYGGPVIVDKLNKRPIMGLMSWNMAYINLNSTTDSTYEADVQTALHEIIHAMGFLKEFYKYYFDSATSQVYNLTSYTDNELYYLATPRLLEHAKRHFNCTQLKGLRMEDEGGNGTIGSHFDRAILYNEVMTGSEISGNVVFTDFTFQLLQDTGFYRVATYTPDYLQWGQNKGCNFLISLCNNTSFPEFCNTTITDSCSFGRTGVAYCKQDILSNSCMYQQIITYNDCREQSNQIQGSATFQYYGYDSICVKGSISKQNRSKTHSCYQYSCDANNKLSLLVDGQVFDCSKPGPVTVPVGYTGDLECPPNASVYCMNKLECPNQCNRNGYCLGGTCNCIKGFSGVQCEVTCSALRYQSKCIDQCPINTYLIEEQAICLGCPANCLECSNYNNCTKCQSSYGLRNGFCDNFMGIYNATNILAAESNSTETIPTNNNNNNTDTDTDTKANTGTAETNSHMIILALQLLSFIVISI